MAIRQGFYGAIIGPWASAARRRARAERGLRRTGVSGARSSTGHAHVARYRRPCGAPIDDEVVSLRLAQDRGVDRRIDQVVALGRAQGRTQVGGILLAEAHVERPGAGQAHAIAAFAEVMGERRDEAEP